MGKSRLALAAAQSALTVFPDGVIFVPLDSVDKPDDVIEAIVSHAGVPRTQDSRLPLQQACAFFANKHVLLVLDNFEHVLGAGGMVTALLQAAPKLKALVTSRERLSLTAETVYPINGLHYPAPNAESDLGEYGAVQLFVQSALRADPRFIVSTQEIAAICRLVQGMPLAIELAAAWVSSMSLAEILTEIERSADFLTSSARDIPERMRSIRAVFEATWSRLTEPERTMFAAMSVFRGGFTSDAAKHVAGAAPRDINALVGKALLWKDPETGRLSIHELLRQYAADALDRAGETARVRDAHRYYYAAYTEKWVISLLRVDEINALAHLDAEYDNIAAAVENAIVVATPEALLPFTGLSYYYKFRGLLHEGVRVFESAITAIDGPDSLALGKFLRGISRMAATLFDWQREDETAIRGLAILERLDARSELAEALAVYAMGPLRHDPERRYSTDLEAYRIAEEYGDLSDTSYLALCVGEDLMDLRRHDEAWSWLERSLAGYLQLRIPSGLALVYHALAQLALENDDFDLARQMYEQSLQASTQLNYAFRMVWAYLGLNACAIMTGDFHAAKQYTLEALRVAHFTGAAREIAVAGLRVADCCCELGEVAEAIEYLRRSATYIVENELTRVERLIVGAAILLRTGHYYESALVYEYIINWRDQAMIYKMDRFRIEANLRALSERLGRAALERAKTEVAGKSIDDMHAMMYALLERGRAGEPPAVVATA